MNSNAKVRMGKTIETKIWCDDIDEACHEYNRVVTDQNQASELDWVNNMDGCDAIQADGSGCLQICSELTISGYVIDLYWKSGGSMPDRLPDEDA